MARLLIERDEEGTGVNVTTDAEELAVADAMLMLELAKMTLLSFFYGGEKVATPKDEDTE
jgi:hypothetical protein